MTLGSGAGNVSGVALPGRDGCYDIRIAEGRIAAVQPSSGTPSGLLALPAFSDLHLHADRAFSGAGRKPTGLADAVALAQESRARSSASEIRERAARLFARALAHGSLRLRTHVDHGSTVGDRAREGVIAAYSPLAETIDVTIVAFANFDCHPGTTDGRRRLVEAVECGAELLGAAIVPWVDDQEGRLTAILDLAAELDVGVDLHLDETSDPGKLWLERLADATMARGLEGRVTASHCCALAVADDATARRTVSKVAAAGITVIALPALNLYLQGRGETTPRVRGITLVHELLAAGVPVRFASDNVRDAFYPYGDADPLEAALLSSLAAQLDDEHALLAGICDGRTGVFQGDPADLVLLEARSFSEVISVRPQPRLVLRDGLVVSAPNDPRLNSAAYGLSGRDGLAVDTDPSHQTG